MKIMDNIVLTTKPQPNSLPGFWEPDYNPEISAPVRDVAVGPFNKSEACIIENVLSSSDCAELIKFMHQSKNFEEVGVQGMKDKKDERIGSMRTSIWSPMLASSIWNKIADYIPRELCANKFTLTDWWQDTMDEESDLIVKSVSRPNLTFQSWAPVAVSPLLRFMEYGEGGQHYAHYDAGFIYPQKEYRTLKSMVIYLTTNENSATRFINDGQSRLPIWKRKHDDWSREVSDIEVIAKSDSIAGNVLLFNHRMCHDVQHHLTAEKRIIIRGDIVYKLKNNYVGQAGE